MTKLTKQQKAEIAVIVTIVGLVALTGLAITIYLIAAFFSPISKKERQELLDYYNDDCTYEIDCGTIEITCYNNGGKHITVYENNEAGLSFMLLDSNYKILEDNGFISLCNVKKQNENVTVYESPEAVTMITNHRSAIHGYYRAVVVELSVGDITYLDYQSGKINMIEYINSIR